MKEEFGLSGRPAIGSIENPVEGGGEKESVFITKVGLIADLSKQLADNLKKIPPEKRPLLDQAYELNGGALQGDLDVDKIISSLKNMITTLKGGNFLTRED